MVKNEYNNISNIKDLYYYVRSSIVVLPTVWHANVRKVIYKFLFDCLL